VLPQDIANIRIIWIIWTNDTNDTHISRQKQRLSKTRFGILESRHYYSAGWTGDSSS